MKENEEVKRRGEGRRVEEEHAYLPRKSVSVF
jgi:hypothetical protein